MSRRAVLFAILAAGLAIFELIKTLMRRLSNRLFDESPHLEV